MSFTTAVTPITSVVLFGGSGMLLVRVETFE